jgi:hypothetical protein
MLSVKPSADRRLESKLNEHFLRKEPGLKYEKASAAENVNDLRPLRGALRASLTFSSLRL